MMAKEGMTNQTLKSSTHIIRGLDDKVFYCAFKPRGQNKLTRLCRALSHQVVSVIFKAFRYIFAINCAMKPQLLLKRQVIFRLNK